MLTELRNYIENICRFHEGKLIDIQSILDESTGLFEGMLSVEEISSVVCEMIESHNIATQDRQETYLTSRKETWDAKTPEEKERILAGVRENASMSFLMGRAMLGF